MRGLGKRCLQVKCFTFIFSVEHSIIFSIGFYNQLKTFSMLDQHFATKRILQNVER